MPKFTPLIRWIGMAALLLLLWTLFNWPSLVHVWWLDEDYFTATHLVPLSTVIWTPLRNGRGLNVFLVYFNAFLMDRGLTFAFVVIHSLQALLHVLAVILTGKILVRFSRSPITFITVLPFLLWPIGNEAVLWISALPYPLAACFSLSGTILLIGRDEVTLRRKIAGMILIALAPFWVQPASLAGLTVFCIALALSIADPVRRSQLLRSSPYLLAACATGLFFSGIIPFLTQESHTQDIHSAVSLIHEIIPQISSAFRYLLTKSSFYPPWLVRLHIATVVTGAICMFLPKTQTIRAYAMSTVGTLFLGLMFVFLLRLPTILLGLLWFSGRTMYLDPLLLTFALCLILQARLGTVLKTSMVSLLVIAICVGYLPISLTYAREHVTVFQRDRETLRGLEDVARRQQTGRLLVAYDAASYPVPNPYSLRYPGFGEVNQSVFTTGWYLSYFLSLYSDTLLLQNDPAQQAPCLAVCKQDTDRQQRRVHVLTEPEKAVCLCP